MIYKAMLMLKRPSIRLPEFPFRLSLTIVLSLVVGLVSIPSAVVSAGTGRIGVLELSNQAHITDDEAYYLTDKVRDAASRVLGPRGFAVMTRESIQVMLPAGTNLTECASGECEVEIGRQIGAEFIVTGEILKFAGELRANIKVHHSQSGRFVGSQSAEGMNLKEIEKNIVMTAEQLFELIVQESKFSTAGSDNATPVTNIPAHPVSNDKSLEAQSEPSSPDVGPQIGRSARNPCLNGAALIHVVRFEPDYFGLSATEQSNLDSLTGRLDLGRSTLKIYGYPDPGKTREYGLALGMKRGMTVRNYLVNKGVSESKILVIPWDEAYQDVDGDKSASVICLVPQ